MPQKIIPSLACGHYSLHIVKELDHEMLVRDAKNNRVSEKPDLGIRKGCQDGEPSVQKCFFSRQHNAIPLRIDCKHLRVGEYTRKAMTLPALTRHFMLPPTLNFLEGCLRGMSA